MEGFSETENQSACALLGFSPMKLIFPLKAALDSHLGSVFVLGSGYPRTKILAPEHPLRAAGLPQGF